MSKKIQNKTNIKVQFLNIMWLHLDQTYVNLSWPSVRALFICDVIKRCQSFIGIVRTGNPNPEQIWNCIGKNNFRIAPTSLECIRCGSIGGTGSSPAFNNMSTASEISSSVKSSGPIRSFNMFMECWRCSIASSFKWKVSRRTIA